MGEYLIFNVTSIVLFSLSLIVLALDIIFKKFYLKIVFGVIVSAFVIASLLLQATYQEILIAVLILAVIALFSFYPPKKEEKL